MPPHLYIVARDRPDLYEYLAHTFAQEPDVEVILDRRRADRYPQPERRAVPRGDRRFADRRLAAQVSYDLRTLGYAFVRRPPA